MTFCQKPSKRQKTAFSMVFLPRQPMSSKHIVIGSFPCMQQKKQFKQAWDLSSNMLFF